MVFLTVNFHNLFLLSFFPSFPYLVPFNLIAVDRLMFLRERGRKAPACPSDVIDVAEVSFADEDVHLPLLPGKGWGKLSEERGFRINDAEERGSN